MTAPLVGTVPVRRFSEAFEVVDAAETNGFAVSIAGSASMGKQFEEQAESDLQRGEMFGIPIALIILMLVFGAQLNFQARDPNEFFFGLEQSHSADTNFIVLPLVIVLVTALIATLALPLGPLLRSMPPLRA